MDAINQSMPGLKATTAPEWFTSAFLYDADSRAMRAFLESDAARRQADLAPRKAASYEELLRSWNSRSCFSAEPAGSGGTYKLLPVVEGVTWTSEIAELGTLGRVGRLDDILAALRPLCAATKPTLAQVSGIAHGCRHRPVLGLAEAGARMQILSAIALTAALTSSPASELSLLCKSVAALKRGLRRLRGVPGPGARLEGPVPECRGMVRDGHCGGPGPPAVSGRLQ